MQQAYQVFKKQMEKKKKVKNKRQQNLLYSRTAFKNPKLFSRITGVDVELIKRLGIILILISSNNKIAKEPFKKYCREIGRLKKSM